MTNIATLTRKATNDYHRICYLYFAALLIIPLIIPSAIQKEDTFLKHYTSFMSSIIPSIEIIEKYKPLAEHNRTLYSVMYGASSLSFFCTFFTMLGAKKKNYYFNGFTIDYILFYITTYLIVIDTTFFLFHGAINITGNRIAETLFGGGIIGHAYAIIYTLGAWTSLAGLTFTLYMLGSGKIKIEWIRTRQ